MTELRLISFLPAATEMVFALGLGDRLVGVSHECDFPAPAKTKPVVVKPALPLEKLSLREIDTAVAERIGSGQGSEYGRQNNFHYRGELRTRPGTRRRFADYVRKLPIDLRTYTIREAVAKMVENSMSLLVVLSTTKNTPIAIVTLHDVLRLQNQLSDAASL